MQEIGRLNARIPQEELTAFRMWCAAHNMTVSRALTGLIHTFNARQQKASEAETEQLRQNIEKAAHLKAAAFKAQGQRLVQEASEPSLSDAGPSLSDGLPMPVLSDER